MHGIVVQHSWDPRVLIHTSSYFGCPKFPLGVN